MTADVKPQPPVDPSKVGGGRTCVDPPIWPYPEPLPHPAPEPLPFPGPVPYDEPAPPCTII